MRRLWLWPLWLLWWRRAGLGVNGWAEEEEERIVADGSRCDARMREGQICDAIAARVCLNGSCESACGVAGMSPCSCPAQADRECYRCCGNARHPCRPAHDYSVFKPNGERWEKASCSVCRDMEDGLPCDDKDPAKLCKAGRCTSDLCRGLPDGAVCDKGQTKICVDNKCVDPCGSGRLLCDCDMSYLSMERAADRCQLCCFDFKQKSCRPAFKHFGIKTTANRPIPRTGLSCGRNKNCDRYGICTKASAARADLFPFLLSVSVSGLLLLIAR